MSNNKFNRNIFIFLVATFLVALNFYIWLWWEPLLSNDKDDMTVLLYLLSSLVQSDAAILGLGSIFLIFKLQSLQSSMLLSLSITGHVGEGIALEQDPSIWRCANLLRMNWGEKENRTLLNIFQKRVRIEAVKKEITPVLILVGLSLIINTIFLWQVKSLATFFLSQASVSVVLTFFLLGVLWSLHLAYILVIKPDQLSIQHPVQVLLTTFRSDETLRNSLDTVHPENNKEGFRNLFELWKQVYTKLHVSLSEDDKNKINQKINEYKQSMERL